MFKIEFVTTNAAFEGDDDLAEIPRILKEIAARVERGETGQHYVHDVNGNVVGHWSYFPEKPED